MEGGGKSGQWYGTAHVAPMVKKSKPSPIPCCYHEHATTQLFFDEQSRFDIFFNWGVRCGELCSELTVPKSGFGIPECS